jgi:hypothetical protein
VKNENRSWNLGNLISTCGYFLCSKTIVATLIFYFRTLFIYINLQPGFHRSVLSVKAIKEFLFMNYVFLALALMLYMFYTVTFAKLIMSHAMKEKITVSEERIRLTFEK